MLELGPSLWSAAPKGARSGLGPELVTNGTFDAGFSGWSRINADANVADGVVTVVTTGANGRIEQAVALDAGATYRAFADVNLLAGAGFDFQIIRGAAGDYAWIGSAWAGDLGPGAVEFTFVAPGADAIVQLVSGAAGVSFTADNVSIRKAAG